MWTRRGVLMGTGLAVAGVVAPRSVWSTDARARRSGALRVALLQSASPFVDSVDLRGSRQRAFTALMVQLERSAAAHRQLDWIAAGVWPMAAATDLPPVAAAAFALANDGDEVATLREFARRHAICLTLAAWWRGRGDRIAPRLLALDRDGTLTTAVPTSSLQATPTAAFAATCARLGLPGAWIEPAADPATAPGVRAPLGGGTRLLDAQGHTIAMATTQAETCVVGALPV